jgi:hypothetical protein
MRTMIRAVYEAIEWDGFLTFADPLQESFNEPVATRMLYITAIRAKDYPHLIGTTLRHTGSNWVETVDGKLRFDLSRARTQVLHQPISKPRASKDRKGPFDWKWSHGKWVKYYL